MDRSIIERYADGGILPYKAIRGLSSDDLNAMPIPGTWSIRQIVVHLMESDLIATDRMKRIAAMQLPLLCGYDETAFSTLPGTDTLDVNLACEIFDKNRQATAHFLRNLNSDAFDRCGIHTESGKLTLAEIVPAYVQHLEHHLRFIHQKRDLLGKPLDE